MTKPFFNVWDVMGRLSISKSMAYRVIRELNQELKQKGYYTISGRVSSDYFNEKFNLTSEEYVIEDPQRGNQDEGI